MGCRQTFLQPTSGCLTSSLRSLLLGALAVGSPASHWRPAAPGHSIAFVKQAKGGRSIDAAERRNPAIQVGADPSNNHNNDNKHRRASQKPPLAPTMDGLGVGPEAAALVVSSSSPPAKHAPDDDGSGCRQRRRHHHHHHNHHHHHHRHAAAVAAPPPPRPAPLDDIEDMVCMWVNLTNAVRRTYVCGVGSLCGGCAVGGPTSAGGDSNPNPLPPQK